MSWRAVRILESSSTVQTLFSRARNPEAELDRQGTVPDRGREGWAQRPRGGEEGGAFSDRGIRVETRVWRSLILHPAGGVTRRSRYGGREPGETDPMVF